MSVTVTGYRHIELSASGVPRIAGTGYGILPLIEQYKARGWSTEDFQRNYPELTQAQVHSMLAYYYDHANEIDRVIQRRREATEAIRSQTPAPPVFERLRALRTNGAP